VLYQSDNGKPVSIARNVRNIWTDSVQQEFTHVATLRKRAYRRLIMASWRKKSLQEVDYRNFGEIEADLKRYVIFYNEYYGYMVLLGRINANGKMEPDKH